MDRNDKSAARQVGPHRGRLALSIGKRASLDVEVAITSGGLLAIGGLVSMILLSTSAIVRTAKASVTTRR